MKFRARTLKLLLGNDTGLDGKMSIQREILLRNFVSFAKAYEGFKKKSSKCFWQSTNLQTHFKILPWLKPGGSSEAVGNISAPKQEESCSQQISCSYTAKRL